MRNELARSPSILDDVLHGVTIRFQHVKDHAGKFLHELADAAANLFNERGEPRWVSVFLCIAVSTSHWKDTALFIDYQLDRSIGSDLHSPPHLDSVQTDVREKPTQFNIIFAAMPILTLDYSCSSALRETGRALLLRTPAHALGLHVAGVQEPPPIAPIHDQPVSALN